MRAACALAAVLVCCGCTSPFGAAVDMHNSGNLAGAAQEVETPALCRAMKQKDRDQLLWLMEGGKILQDGGPLERSSEVLFRASAMSAAFATLDNRPSAAELVGSAIVNPTVRTYRGTYSERIRIEAYQTLNQLLMGQVREAAVYARRTGERQTDAKVLQTKEMAAAAEDARTWRNGQAEVQLQQILNSKELSELDADASYAAYLDPFASWISGIAWCATGDGQEYQQGVSNLQEALQMMPGNACLQAQVVDNPFVAARAGHAQVLIVYESGIAPWYKQVTIPLFTPWTGVSTIPLQFPEYSHSDDGALTVLDSHGTVISETHLLANYNKIFGAQYKRMQPDIIFGTLVMIAVKEGATLGGYFATQGSSEAQAGVLIAASIYKALTNQADLRTWRTPGNAIGIAQVARPADGVLEFRTPNDGATVHRVNLPDGLVTMVFVRSVVPGQVRSTVAPIWGTTPGPPAL